MSHVLQILCSDPSLSAATAAQQSKYIITFHVPLVQLQDLLFPRVTSYLRHEACIFRPTSLTTFARLLVSSADAIRSGTYTNNSYCTARQQIFFSTWYVGCQKKKSSIAYARTVGRTTRIIYSCTGYKVYFLLES